MSLIREYVEIKDYCTLRVGGQFRYFVEISHKDELREIYEFAENNKLPVFILGSGSNVVFRDGILEAVTIKVNLFGFKIITNEHSHMDLEIGAGENWDSVVLRSVGLNLSGIEAMSAIPGTAGATPVQNVGAYGQEIKDTLLSVEVFNTIKREFEFISNTQCKFKYRDSIFKSEGKGKYFIVAIILRLSKLLPTLPDYRGVKEYFEDKEITTPSLKEIREAIINIRSVKLPNPKKIPNVGSFFKNPIVEIELINKIKEDFPKIITFPIDDEYVKVPAGWLIEHSMLKGKNFGSISVYDNNALVLVNNGGASCADIIAVKDEIIKTVLDNFSITLETEPEFI